MRKCTVSYASKAKEETNSIREVIDGKLMLTQLDEKFPTVYVTQ